MIVNKGDEQNYEIMMTEYNKGGYDINEYEDRYELVQRDPNLVKQDNLIKLEQWFVWYDLQVKKHERNLRLGIQSDITELDELAQNNAELIEQLREELLIK